MLDVDTAADRASIPAELLKKAGLQSNSSSASSCVMYPSPSPHSPHSPCSSLTPRRPARPGAASPSKGARPSPHLVNKLKRKEVVSQRKADQMRQNLQITQAQADAEAEALALEAEFGESMMRSPLDGARSSQYCALLAAYPAFRFSSCPWWLRLGPFP